MVTRLIPSRRSFAAVAALVLVAVGCVGDQASVDEPGESASVATVAPTTSTSMSGPTSLPATEEIVERYEQVLVLGDGDGIEFLGPNHLALDTDDNLYVTEFGGGRVFVFSPEGELLRQFAGAGDEIGELSGPTGIAVDADGFIYVGESGTSRVQKFSPEGDPIAVWGKFGVGRGEFGSAMGIGINEELGRVYVADHVNSRIHVYTTDGELLFMFPRGGDYSQIGDEPDQMWLPIGVDLAADGTVYVVDTGNRRVQKFNPDGDIVEVLSSGPVVSPQVLSVEDDGSYWLTGPNDLDIVRFSATGEVLATLVPPAGGFASPHGTEVSADGTVWVADSGNGVVRAYRLSETTLAAPVPTSSTTTVAAGPPPDVEIAMINYGYEPTTVTIKVGDTVRWVNPTSIQHTATLEGLFDSGPVGQGGSFTYTFEETGTFHYLCSIHGAALQSGTIIVEP